MTDILAGLNEPQLKIATTLDEPVFVAAGAGSGKTFTLTRRIVWALTPGSGKDGAPYLESLDKALIITFTEKAAAEIRERIRSALHEAGMHGQALTADSAWISTIHGMCSRILHAEAIQLGLNPKFEMIADHEADELRTLAANEVLAEIRDAGEFSGLMEAYPASSSRDGSSEGGTSILGMAMSLAEKAAQRADGFEGIGFPSHTASAHSVASELLARYEELAGIPPQKGKDKQAQAMEEIIRSRDELVRYLDQAPSKITFESLAEVLKSIARPDGNNLKWKEVKEARVAATQALAVAKNTVACEVASVYEDELMQIARRIDERFSEFKSKRGVLDNDDLLVMTHRAFKDHPEIAERYRGFFDLVMIDEFQDTNSQQIEMIKLIAGDAPICTVGDAQQSIYRFRGADVEVFKATERSARDVIRMDTNFRSNDDVLRLVANVCDNQPGIDGCFVPDFMDLKAGGNGTGRYPGSTRVYYELSVLTKKRNAANKRAMELQAKMLASRLAKLRDQGVEPRDMAILFRRMGNIGIYQQALREYGLDSVIAGGSTFASAPEVGVVMALLNVLANPKDTKEGLYPTLASEMFRLEGDDFIALATRMQETVDAPTKRRIDAGLLSGEYVPGVAVSERLERAAAILSGAWLAMKREPIADVVLGVCRDSGWLSRLQNLGVEGRAQAANVLRAIEHLREFCKDNAKGPVSVANEFKAWLASSSTGPASLAGGDSNAVQIMTIHASKGLEFPVVAVAETFTKPRPASANGIVYLDDDGKTIACLKPPSDSLYEGSNKDLPEDECIDGTCENAYEWRRFAENSEARADELELGRLVYVGLTRAKDALVVSSSVSVTKNGPTPQSAALLNNTLGGNVEAGVTEFDYGGSAPGIQETVVLGADDDLDAVIAEARDSGTGIFSNAPVAVEERENASFSMYKQESAPGSFRPWSTREGVFSYTSAHKTVEPLVFERDETEVRAQEFDPDRATSLGTAFHVLAQFIAETGSYPDEERVASVAREAGVRSKDMRRLRGALKRWYDSDLRQDTLLAHSVHAELPFFVEVVSKHGQWLEGAFDLLCDMGSGIYHVVDYKTGDIGLDAGQARALHEMQARYYARVLLDEGAKHVTCTFVLVERDLDGQPMTVAYEYDRSDIPSLDR